MTKYIHIAPPWDNDHNISERASDCFCEPTIKIPFQDLEENALSKIRIVVHSGVSKKEVTRALVSLGYI